jgi:hypothetical protein
MPQHDFYSFANLITFFSKKKVTKYLLFIFIFHIGAKFQPKEKKPLHGMCIGMFSITSSHFERIT